MGGARGGGAVNLREERLAPAADEAGKRREGEEERERDEAAAFPSAKSVCLADDELLPTAELFGRSVAPSNQLSRLLPAAMFVFVFRMDFSLGTMTGPEWVGERGSWREEGLWEGVEREEMGGGERAAWADL